MESFAALELASSGRAVARTQATILSGDLPPALALMRQAARASLDQQPLPPDAIPPGLDPLWPALSRHLCRQATPADRQLLTDLCQNPALRPPPLCWGLQYIVRGDVLLDGGDVVILDQLADAAGLPRLPSLEDLPPELPIDLPTD